MAIDGPAAVTAIDCSVAGFTVRLVDPPTLPDVAVILLLPTATAVANPELLIVATLVVADIQVTELVRFCVLLSE